jgi:hypothetical protein
MSTLDIREQGIQRTIFETAAEHAELLARARAVEQLIETTHYPPPGDVARKLRALADYLATHIAEEEESALYTTIPNIHPELRKELENRKGEHGPLLVAVRQLAADADQAHDVSMASALGTRIRSAIAALRQHEAGESSLLHRARHQTSV